MSNAGQNETVGRVEVDHATGTMESATQQSAALAGRNSVSVMCFTTSRRGDSEYCHHQRASTLTLPHYVFSRSAILDSASEETMDNLTKIGALFTVMSEDCNG